jgi:hypothetical protein
MPVVRAEWANELDSVVNLRFAAAFAARARTQVLSSLFTAETSTGGDENVIGAGVVSPNAWDNYENSGAISEADFDKGYLKTFTHKEYPLDVRIERKLLDDSRFREITDLVNKLGDSAAVKREFDRASVFNNAFSASFLGGDGVSLCNASHPLSPSKSGSTQSNTGTSALTAANVSATRELMRKFTDDAMTPAGSIGNLLVVPIDLMTEAEIISGSPFDPDSAENAVNPESGLQFLVSDYLTDTNNWFLIDTNLMRQQLLWFDRVPLSINPVVEDKTVSAAWRAYMRYSFGFSNWTWIFGHEVA